MFDRLVLCNVAIPSPPSVTDPINPLLTPDLFLQILFISGLAFIIGLERTFWFFCQRHKLKASGFFTAGVIVVLIGYPFIGMCVEIYGFFLLFKYAFGFSFNFCRSVEHSN